MTQEEKQIAGEFIAHAPSTVVVSVDENGYPRPVPVFKVKCDGFNVWFATRRNSAKMKDFSVDDKSGMCFISGHDTVALRGKVRIVEEAAEKESLWKPGYAKMFPGGITDPNLAFIKFSANEVTTFIDGKLNHHSLIED